MRLPVADQGEEAREQAFVLGLQQQLAQLSDAAGAFDQAQQTELEQQARDFITSYRYLSRDDGRLLEVRYDIQALEEELKQQGVAVVIEQRPKTVIWLALEQNNQRQLVADGSQQARQFIQLGQEQAAPLLFPVLDLDDFSQLDTAEVWGLFEEPIKKASLRYQTPSVLAGQIYENSEGRFQGQWLYLFNDQSFRQRIDAQSLESAMRQGTELVAARLTEQLVNNQQRDTGVMRVEFVGVQSAQEYAQLLELVGSLAPVRSVQVGGIEPDALNLQLQIDSAPEVVEQLLLRDQHLKALAMQPQTSADGTPLTATQALRLQWLSR